jgi:type IV secretory pathway TrbD component
VAGCSDLCILLLQGWYIVTYALGIYHLNLFIAFLSPKVDPSLMEDSGRVEAVRGTFWAVLCLCVPLRMVPHAKTLRLRFMMFTCACDVRSGCICVYNHSLSPHATMRCHSVILLLQMRKQAHRSTSKVALQSVEKIAGISTSCAHSTS